MVEAPYTGAVVRTASIWRSSSAGPSAPLPDGPGDRSAEVAQVRPGA
jgi:hypothetical protein